MTADGSAEIDLYDNIDEDFVQECADFTEFYEDVMVPSSVETIVSTPISAIDSKPTLSTASNHTGRRVATYVGNLTWWTTDQDLLEATNGVGINDVVEIKFHENRQNGQSKGFCVVVFGSDQSVRTAMEKLPKIEIHGQNPVVTHCTKHNLSIFEKAAGSDTQQTSRARSDELSSKMTGVSSQVSSSSSSRVPPPLMATPTMPASLGFSLRNNSSLMGQAITNIRQMSNAVTNSLQQVLGTQSIHSGLGANSQLNQLSSALPSVSSVLMPPGLPAMPLSGNASILPTAFGLQGALPTSIAGANTHINPNFIPQQVSVPSGVPPPLMQLSTSGALSSARPQHFDNYGRPVIHTYTPSSTGKLSESEFEDILQRNKTVSSSAINRAVQDAASGDYASAIETLVTAISLIKQSKIASDDRCKILINSLQDTLHGIESKSYGLKGSSRRRRRSYSDSGSEGGMDGYSSSLTGGGSGSRHHRVRGNRSRSRDRHDRHDRHRRSRDRTSNNNTSYYGSQSAGLQMPGGSSLSGVSLSGLSSSGPGNGSGSASNSADRYRDSRYRH